MVSFFPYPMNVELHEFIADGARRITPAHLDKLIRWLPEIRLAVTQVTEFPNLPDQVEFLAEIVEDFHAGLNRSIPGRSQRGEFEQKAAKEAKRDLDWVSRMITS
jgi:hypothetical protein